jgi:diguanylate cyclase (GGDEF)-like protein
MTAEGERVTRNVLLGSASRQLAAELEHHLPGARVRLAVTGAEVLQTLRQASEATALLILDDDLDHPPALDVLRQVRSAADPLRIPIIYCLGEGPRDAPRALVEQYGVSQMLFHPVECRELARQAAFLLGIPHGEEPRSATSSTEGNLAAELSSVWDRFAASTLPRLEVLEQAGADLLEGRLSPDLRQRAVYEAHRLAGSLGTFGFAAGSRFAREMEHILEHASARDDRQALRFSELAVALRIELERAAQTSMGEPAEDSHPRLMIIEHDSELADKLAVEAVSRGMRVETVTEASRLAGELENPPDAILLDLDFDTPEKVLGLLDRLAGGAASTPTLALTDRNSLTDRVEVARRGAQGFLPKTLSPSQIVEAAVQLLERRREAETRVMAVDDDPQVLAALRALLEGRRIRVCTLDNPLRFWETLEEFAPDLLILDVDMPHLSGIELCRVVRNDPRWSAEPVLFLTAHNDAETVRRVFAAGADDFVSKPIVGPELLTRIFNRLERSRLHRSLAEEDPLTGLANRRKGERTLAQFERLAQRYSQPLTLALVRPDGLRTMNAQHGYAAGDAVLRRLGQLLQKAFHSEDVVARWGGQEFVIGMLGLTRSEGVQRLAEVLEALRMESFHTPSGPSFRATFSAGVAQFPEDGATVAALYRAAEVALGQAKASGRDRVLPYGWSNVDRSPASVDVALAMRDEAEACLLLHALETRGYQARWLRDGNTAVQLLCGSQPALKPSVILLEVDLPGMDGLQLLGRLAADRVLERSRVIMITVPSIGDEAATALALGAFDHVVRPFSPPAVMFHIRRALESMKGREPEAAYRRVVTPLPGWPGSRGLRQRAD